MLRRLRRLSLDFGVELDVELIGDYLRLCRLEDLEQLQSLRVLSEVPVNHLRALNCLRGAALQRVEATH